MSVSLLSDLDPAAEAVRLGQWAAGYRSLGRIGGLLAPARAAGQPWVAVIRGVGRDELDQRDLADPGILIGHGTARDPAHQAWLSAEEIAFAGARRVLATWRLDDLFAVRALADLTGIALLATEPNPDYDDRFPALLSDVVRRSPRASGPVKPGYNRRRVETDWLKFEAVFAERRGDLAAWTRDLYPRLADIVQGARNGSPS